MTTVVLAREFGVTKEILIPLLRAQGVDVRPFFYPLSAIPAFQKSSQAGLARARNKTAYAVTPYGINLPSALNLTEPDVARVSEILRKAMRDALDLH